MIDLSKLKSITERTMERGAGSREIIYRFEQYREATSPDVILRLLQVIERQREALGYYSAMYMEGNCMVLGHDPHAAKQALSECRLILEGQE